MVFYLVLCELILCGAFLDVSTAVYPYEPASIKLRPQDDFDFSSEEATITTPYDQRNNPIRRTLNNSNNRLVNPRDNPQDQVSNLLKEVGINQPQKMYRKVYNDSKKTKICWKTITYVRKNNLVKTDKFPWREYELVFDFPDQDDSKNIENNSSDEILTYKIRDPETTKVEELNFTVIEKSATFTISRHEKITCGTGKFLTKIYYEWPQSDRKRIVVKLSDKLNESSDEKHEVIGQSFVDQNRSSEEKEEAKNNQFFLEDRKNPDRGPRTGNVGDNINVMKTNGSKKIGRDNRPKAPLEKINSSDEDLGDFLIKRSENLQPKPSQKKLEGSNILPQHRKPMHKINNTKNNDTKGEKSQLDNIPQHNEDDEFMDLAVGASAPKGLAESYEKNYSYREEDIFDVPEVEASANAIASSKSSTVNPCSPILTTLLSENGLFSGLCNLRKNEKVVLEGDITVSKKYFNKENTEIVEPLYTIRENTEIKAYKDI